MGTIPINRQERVGFEGTMGLKRHHSPGRLANVPGIVEKRAPICGVLSVAAPFASVAVALFVDKVVRILYPGDEGRFFILAYVMLPIICGMIAGMVLAYFAA